MFKKIAVTLAALASIGVATQLIVNRFRKES